MIGLLIYLAVFVIVAALVWWVLQQLPLPEPIAKIVLILFVVICAIILISILLSMVGGGGLHIPTLR
jgi:hypothetical protein